MGAAPLELLWKNAFAHASTRRWHLHAGGLHAALHGAVPFSRDGVTLLHTEGHYALGASPLALLWKDASCSRYHLDTDAAGVVPPRQSVTLQCLPGGGVGTGDEQPTALARLPDAAVQQLGERLRYGWGLPDGYRIGYKPSASCDQQYTHKPLPSCVQQWAHF